jgi:hypothetical protein
MNLPAASKVRISFFIPLTLTLSHRGEREQKVSCSELQGIIKLNSIGSYSAEAD